MTPAHMDALESLSEELIRDLEQRLATAVTNCLTEQSNVTVRAPAPTAPGGLRSVDLTLSPLCLCMREQTTAPQRKPVVDALILDITKQLRVPIDQRVQQEAEVLRQTSARQEAELVELRQAAQAQAQRQLELERLRTAASERDALRNKCEQLAAAAERGQALQEKVASQADDLRSLRAELAAALQRAARTSTVTSEQVADGSEQLAKNVVAKVREAKLAAEGTDVGGKDVEWSATAWMRRDGTVIDAVAEALLAPLQRVAAATDATVAAGGAAALPGEMQQQYVSGLAEQLGPPEEGATVLAGWLESAGVVHKLAAKLDKAARLLRAEVEQRAESDRAAATAPGGDSKFEMAFGGLETFYGGLEKYVGLPDVPVEKALEGEHTKRCDSFRDFEATNLGITTKSIWEYWFVADPSQEKVKELARHPRAPMTSGAWPREAKNDTLSGVREPLSADTGPLQYEREERNRELLKLNADQLMRTELVAARLYTGVCCAPRAAATPPMPLPPSCASPNPRIRSPLPESRPFPRIGPLSPSSRLQSLSFHTLPPTYRSSTALSSVALSSACLYLPLLLPLSPSLPPLSLAHSSLSRPPLNSRALSLLSLCSLALLLPACASRVSPIVAALRQIQRRAARQERRAGLVHGQQVPKALWRRRHEERAQRLPHDDPSHQFGHH